MTVGRGGRRSLAWDESSERHWEVADYGYVGLQRRRRLTLGHLDAVGRAFIPRDGDGVVRLYRFMRADYHTYDDRTLRRQLSESYPATTTYGQREAMRAARAQARYLIPAPPRLPGRVTFAMPRTVGDILRIRSFCRPNGQWLEACLARSDTDYSGICDPVTAAELIAQVEALRDRSRDELLRQSCADAVARLHAAIAAAEYPSASTEGSGVSAVV